jgi:hypothetical protein
MRHFRTNNEAFGGVAQARHTDGRIDDCLDDAAIVAGRFGWFPARGLRRRLGTGVFLVRFCHDIPLLDVPTLSQMWTRCTFYTSLRSTRIGLRVG